jgi:hypothetical protein
MLFCLRVWLPFGTQGGGGGDQGEKKILRIKTPGAGSYAYLLRPKIYWHNNHLLQECNVIVTKKCASPAVSQYCRICSLYSWVLRLWDQTRCLVGRRDTALPEVHLVCFIVHICIYNRTCSLFSVLEIKILCLFALNVAEYSLRQETLLELEIIIRILSLFCDQIIVVLIRECLLLSRE